MGPSGVDCSMHVTCSVEQNSCAAGETCIAIRGCESPVCISTDQACAQTCPTVDDCALLESFPLQIACDGYATGYGPSLIRGDSDSGAPTGEVCGDSVCPLGERCCDHCSGSCTSLENICPHDLDTDYECADGGPATEQCGNTMCAIGERCCDSCSNSCVTATAEIACPNDNDPNPVCDGQQTFACGETSCDGATDYCYHVQGDPETFTCTPWEGACADDHTCDCLMAPVCGEADTGGVTVTVSQL
jgi:hypothetical protein